MRDAAPQTLRIDDQLCFALYAATNAVTRAYRPLLAALDLTYPQYLVMMVLWQDGAATVGRIADRLRLGSNAVTPLVDQLEASGLIARRRDETDRRLVFVTPTEAGRRLERSAALAQESVVGRTGLSDADLAVLREDLHRLVNRLAASRREVEENRPRPTGGPDPGPATIPG